LLRASIPPSVRIGVAQRRHREHPGFRLNPSSRALETKTDATGGRGYCRGLGDDVISTAAPDRGTKGEDSDC